MVFVLYGTFGSNSAGHVCNFANGLVRLGLKVAVVGDGPEDAITHHGSPLFATINRASIVRAPIETLHSIFEQPLPKHMIFHAWTPRERARLTIAAVTKSVPGRIVVHLEDNEQVVAETHIGMSIASMRRLEANVLDQLIGSDFTHPIRGPQFVNSAHGVTVIVDALRALIEPRERVLTLLPGAEIPSPIEPAVLDRRRSEFGLKPHEALVVYPGSIHPANREEVFSLVLATRILGRRGFPTRLLKTGPHVEKRQYKPLRSRHVTDLGFVPRSVLLELLGSSDFLVQPGCSNAFNDYRLPSKLPDFLASGRPVILPRTNLGLMVRDGVEALLLDVGDAEEIAAKVAWVLSNPEQAKRIGAAGREFARQMSWENQAARLAAFYEDVLRQPMTNSA